MISKTNGDKVNVHLIISHPKGNETFAHRIKSFQKILEINNYKVKIPHILYPFENFDRDISKEAFVLSEASLINVEPKQNIIQKAVYIIKKSESAKSFTKILYGLHILFYKTDLWYVALFKFYKINPLAPNIVIASGGPGSVFRMGYELAIKNNTKLILDYRDPWNLGYQLLKTNGFFNIIKRKLTLNQELKILKRADHITTVSESIKNFFPKEHHHKISVIENGSNFEQENIIHQINPRPEKFSINYLGTVYTDQLFEEDFFIAFADFYDSIQNKDSISLNFIGSDKNIHLKELIKKYRLENVTKITKRVNKEDLFPYLINASIFLQLRFNGRSEIITSKITDYLMFRKPILLPVSDEGDIAETIKKYQAGYICNGIDETKTVLNKEYLKFLEKEDITIHQKDLSYLSRAEISKKLIKVIEDLEID